MVVAPVQNLIASRRQAEKLCRRQRAQNGVYNNLRVASEVATTTATTTTLFARNCQVVHEQQEIQQRQL